MADPRLTNLNSAPSFATGQNIGGLRDDSFRFETLQGRFTRMDGFRASRKHGQFDSATNVIGRMVERRNLYQEAEEAGSEFIDPETLNEMFRDDLVQPFKAPVPWEVANFIVERQREMKRLDEIIANTPDGAFSGLAVLAGGMSAFVTDPVEILADILIGPVTGFAGTVARHSGRAARAAARAKKAYMSEERALQAAQIGRKLEKLGRKTEKVGDALLRSGSFGTSVARGLSVNIASEGLAQVNAAQDQLDRSVLAAMGAVAGGTVALAGLGSLGRRMIGRMTGAERKAALELVHHQADLDIPVDVTPLVRELNARGRGTGTEYRFNPNRAEVSNQVLFMPSKSKKFSESSQMGELRVGRRGVVIGDKYSEVNAAATRPNESPGTIFSVRAKRELNFLDLDANLEDAGLVDSLVNAVVDSSQSFRPRGAKKVGEIRKRYKTKEGKPKTARQIFEQVEDDIAKGRLNDEALDALEDALQSYGFDGFSYTNSGRGSIQDPTQLARPNQSLDPDLASNMFKVFNRDLLEVGSRASAKKGSVGKAYSKKQLQQMREAQQSPTQDRSFSPEVDKIRQETPDTALPAERLPEFQAREQQALENVNELLRNTPEELRPQIEVMMRDYEALVKFSRDLDPAVKGAVKCLGGK